MPGPRPDRLVLVVGTGTEVGKTWVACALAARLRADGLKVAARKPLQSFDPGDGRRTDADLLAAATGEPPAEVCPSERSYPVPLAPPMAAAALGWPVLSLAEVAEGIEWQPGTDVGLVETAGGVRSPLAPDGDNVGLARLLDPDLVVLVADAGLGVINSVRLCVDALRAWSTTVFMNRFDQADALHRLNLDWLKDRDGFDVLVDIADLAGRLAGLRAPAPG